MLSIYKDEVIYRENDKLLDIIQIVVRRLSFFVFVCLS